MPVTRLNHAVLYVRDADATAAFYEEHLEFEIAERIAGAVFLKCRDSLNDHDLGLFSIGDGAAPSSAGRQQVGLYHLAWEVPTLGELADLAQRLQAAGALSGASDHGPSRSLYCKDPDGIEFEVFWAVPPESMNEQDAVLGVRPLNLEADLARFGRDLIGRSTFVAPA